MSTVQITEKMAMLLGMLSSLSKPTGSVELVTLAGGTRQSQVGLGAAFALDLLIQAGLVDRRNRCGKFCSINDAGLAALAEYRAGASTAYARPVRHTSCGAPYTPNTSTYYRNNGDRHIASRGAGC